MHLTFLVLGLFCFVGFSISSCENENTIDTCGGKAIRNNTNWQVNAYSNCSLTIKTNTLPQICQIRLDFISFTTVQPVAGTCVDTFQVTGSTSSVPIICGDNAGQHMYFDVSSSSDVKLLFSLKSDVSMNRSWNIKIAMLPCGAPYLGIIHTPLDCLQYFTGASGRIKSYNWMDVFQMATRQLNNQKYNICFRTEIAVSGLKASHICYSPCPTVNGGGAFSITTPPADLDGMGNSATGTVIGDAPSSYATCLYDFLLIAGGRDPNTGFEADRFCGSKLNTSPGKPFNTVVCTPITPFRIFYRTDGTEAAVVAGPMLVQAGADVANTGFCLDYQEK